MPVLRKIFVCEITSATRLIRPQLCISGNPNIEVAFQAVTLPGWEGRFFADWVALSLRLPLFLSIERGRHETCSHLQCADIHLWSWCRLVHMHVRHHCGSGHWARPHHLRQHWSQFCSLLYLPCAGKDPSVSHMLCYPVNAAMAKAS